MFDFPFAVQMIEFTTYVLKCLRDGKLHKDIKATNSLPDVCNELYSAAVWHFMTNYIKGQGTI